ncbi:MAG: molybdopterin-dependent oxidoreductase, partial [Acidimicrobiales bacterium]|nr:molybdopterin-dependent oxidoreductase [Acidimicrobiales bacterium]
KLPRPDQLDEDGRVTFGRWHSRVRGAPEVLGQVPVSCLAEEIATPGDGQLKGLVTIAGNPVISSPDCAALDAALPMLDCMISIDNWLNETTRHAHVILPGQSHLEQPHMDEMIWSWAIRNASKWSAPIFDIPDDQPREWEVLLTLAGLFLGMPADGVDTAMLDDAYFAGFVGKVVEYPQFGISDRDPTEIVAATEGRGPDRFVDLAIRTGSYGDRYGANPDGWTFEKLKAHPNGIDLGPLRPRVREVLQTPNGRIDAAPDYVVNDLPRLRARLARSDDGLVLVSRRHLRSNNSWMHNVKVLVKGKDRCTLMMHPTDAEAAGVADGGVASVSSESGSIEISVEVTDEMMPGVVSLPHGWGHDLDGVQLSVAKEFAGVNSNILSPGHLVDAISGNAVVNGIPVEVAPAEARASVDSARG